MHSKEQFETRGDFLLVRAPAKINLTLLVKGKRSDGYHELETIMAKVNWYDALLFEAIPKPNTIALRCTGSQWAPEGPENLVYRACTELARVSGYKGGIRITLKKNIPAGGGLGGGSSDAAAALMGMNRFCRLNQPYEVLHRIAAKLGSDIAFFLGPPVSRCTGRGEKIEPIPDFPRFSARLFLPGINISTAAVYGNFRPDERVFRSLKSQINQCLTENNVDFIGHFCANMLEMSCYQLNEQLAQIKSRIESWGFNPVCLSGSGSTMFSIIQGPGELDKASESGMKQSVGCESIKVYSNGW